MDPFWLALLAKMLTSAVVVVAASLVVERTGSFVGAMVATLPISAGPAYAFLAAEHGATFVAESALVTVPPGRARSRHRYRSADQLRREPSSRGR